MPSEETGLTYREAGVETGGAIGALQRLLYRVNQAEHCRCDGSPVGRVALESGYFATVIDIGNLGLAMTTDGVGTKLLVAQMMGKYDTVGIDCVAMVANDLVCVGAEPVSMLDYIAVEKADPDVFEQIGIGLQRGADYANISISGGEIAQVREMLRGYREGSGLDLVGMAIGLVPLEEMIVGEDIDDGDVVVGLKSNGIHSNGYTLARRVLFDEMGLTVDSHVPELGRSIGEELLRPTAIYVRPAVDMMRADVRIKAFSHMTGDGFLNLLRVRTDTGFVLDCLPEPDPVFQVLQEGGRLSDEEMFLVFNMGIGFGVVTPEKDAAAVRAIARRHGFEAWVLGRAAGDLSGKVVVEPRQLIGENDEFRKI